MQSVCLMFVSVSSVCILFGDLGALLWEFFHSAVGVCVSVRVCVCALRTSFGTLNGSVLVAAKYIHYPFLIYIDPQEGICLFSTIYPARQIGGGWMDGQVDSSWMAVPVYSQRCCPLYFWQVLLSTWSQVPDEGLGLSLSILCSSDGTLEV